MLKIAMLDHHLNNWHSDTFLRLFRGALASEEVDVVTAWESNPTGDDWCAKNGVTRAASAEDAVKGADAIMVMAPDNIDEHLKLAGIALPCGKPTVVDKFLAPTLDEAKQIVAMSKKYGAPIMSASGLRFAVEVEAMLPEVAGKTVTEGFVRGLSAWNLYGIHSLAIALRFMGHDIRRIIDTGTPAARTVTLDYGGTKRVVLDVRTAANEWDHFVWSFAFRAGDNYHAVTVANFDGFYENLMRAAVPFLKTGKTDMPVEEMLTAVAVIEGADRSLAQGGVWIDL